MNRSDMTVQAKMSYIYAQRRWRFIRFATCPTFSWMWQQISIVGEVFAYIGLCLLHFSCANKNIIMHTLASTLRCYVFLRFKSICRHQFIKRLLNPKARPMWKKRRFTSDNLSKENISHKKLFALTRKKFVRSYFIFINIK